MQKRNLVLCWLALFIAIACTMGLSPALYAADDPAIPPEPGLLVLAVDPQGPAAAAGIKRGDIILAIDGNPVNRLADLMAALDTMTPPARVILQVQHGDEVQKIAVTTIVRAQRAYLGILPYAEPVLDISPSAPPVPPVVQQTMPLPAAPDAAAVPNVTATTVTSTLTLVILEVMPGSAAAAAGLQPQDVITAVDGHVLDAPDALRAQVAGLQPGEPVTLTITRGEEAPHDVVVNVGKGSAGQAILGVKVGVAVMTTMTSQGEDALAAPAVPAAPPVEFNFHRFREMMPFQQWTMPGPGCMSDGGNMGYAQPEQNMMRFRSGTIMIAPAPASPWVAQPVVPAEPKAVIVVERQLAPSRAQMAEVTQSGIVVVSPAQPLAAPMQLPLPGSQADVLMLDAQAAPAQLVLPAEPTVGDYY